MTTMEWTCVAAEVDAALGAGVVHGQGVVLAPPGQAERILGVLAHAGYFLVGFDGAEVSDFREAQAMVAAALQLGEGAAGNLDAMTDELRDLASRWPESDRLVLVWENAHVLIQQDLPGWTRLTDVLRGASFDLWRGEGGADERLFETLAVVEGMGV